VKKTPQLVVIISLVAAVLVFVISGGLRPTTNESGRAVTAVNHHYLGDQFSVGYWTYKISSAEWQDAIEGRRANASFLVVGLSVRNDDRTSSSLPPMHLIDAEGREFDATTTFMNNELSILQMLNPTVQTRGFVVFEAPRGSYTLVVSGGYKSGEHAQIVLSQRANAQTPVPLPGKAPAPPWVDVSVLGFKAGESAEEATDHARALGMTKLSQRGCTETLPVVCSFLGDNGESMEVTFCCSSELQKIDYEFPVARYGAILEKVEKTLGAPRIATYPSDGEEARPRWGSPGERFDVSILKATDGVSAAVSVSFYPKLKLD
jgi:hypothetical protein